MGLTLVPRRLGAAAFVAVLAACGHDASPAVDTTAATASTRASGAASIGKPACPATGHWSACTVLARLQAAGVAPLVATSLPDLPSMAVKPAMYNVGRSGLAVYLFADSSARAAAARALDTLHYVSAAKELTMRGETTAIQNDNLLALLYSRSEQQRERVSDALMAGPPQPMPSH